MRNNETIDDFNPWRIVYWILLGVFGIATLIAVGLWLSIGVWGILELLDILTFKEATSKHVSGLIFVLILYFVPTAALALIGASAIVEEISDGDSYRENQVHIKDVIKLLQAINENNPEKIIRKLDRMTRDSITFSFEVDD